MKKLLQGAAFSAGVILVWTLLEKIRGQQRMIRRQTEELADDRGTIKAITDNMREGLVVLTPAETVLSVNSSAISLLGAAQRTYLGQSL